MGSDVCATVETVPDDFFTACTPRRADGCRMEKVPAYFYQERDKFLRHFTSKSARVREVPDLYAMRVPCKSTFGGRWFAPGYLGAPRASIVVILTDDEYERGVLFHELTHWGRWVDSLDKFGRHDSAFLKEVEKVYRTFHVTPEVGRAIEHNPKGFFSGRGDSPTRSTGNCYGARRGA
jgi:hypothetical protein